MPNTKELAHREELHKRFTGAHALCAGCGIPICVRTILNAIEEPVVVINATGCLEVATTRYPTTAWNVPWIHVAFENAAAVASGVETAYRVLRQRGKISQEIRFVAFGGDGGTYDIGLQALSGALERGHRFIYVCYDNEAYMNTGNQRSGATPLAAQTSTTPLGERSFGKPQRRKDLTEIVAAHHIPYVAQASISDWYDLARKARQAASVDGPAFLNVLSTCPRGWGHPTDQSVKIARLAVETCYWPLYEIIEERWVLNYIPEEKLPITEWLRPQKRFAHLFEPQNRELLRQIQQQVDEEWEKLLRKCERYEAL
jgi:pyruvate ferredoxin oxidoreductase beta subunit